MILELSIIRRLLSNRWVLGLLVLMAVVVIALTARRTHQQYSKPSLNFDWSQRGMSDFHNGTYYPTLAFAHGDNPYAASVREKYPMARQSPIYSPIVFWLHLPFIIFDVQTSAVLFFVYNLGLLVLLAWLAVRWSLPPPSERQLDATNTWHLKLGLFLTTLLFLLVSRPGHITLFTGYFTLELVLGTVIAIHYSRRYPVVAGIGILLASGKPTYVIPLVLLLLVTRRFRAVFWGLLFSFVAGMTGLIWLAASSDWESVFAGIRDGQEGLHADPTELPINTWTRVDALALVAKYLKWAPDDKIYLLGMLGQIAIVSPWLWLSSKNSRKEDLLTRDVTGWIGLAVILTMTVSIYHHSYDTLLLTVPMFGLLFRGSKNQKSNWVDRWPRLIVFILCSVPFWNLFSTQSFRDRVGWDSESTLWQGVTMINGISLILALLITLYELSRQLSRPNQPQSG